MGVSNRQFYLDNLNPEQHKVALHTGGPAAVFAGPGSGKTRTLIANILHRIVAENADPKKIVVTTFTQKAAKEIKNRLERATAKERRWYEAVQELQVGTIHSFCLTLLRKYGFGNLSGCTNLVNFDENDILLFLCVHAQDLGLSFDSFKSVSEKVGGIVRSKRDKRPVSYEGFLARLAGMFALLSEGLHSNEELTSIKQSSDEGNFLLECYEKYLRLTSELGILDHSLILKRTHDLLALHPSALTSAQNEFDTFIIDEFQDTNGIQDRIFSLLAKKQENIMVVGDEDQSIYGFRGARVELFRTFASRWQGRKKVAEYVLSGNYRSARTIITHFNEYKTDAFNGVETEIRKLSTPILKVPGLVTKIIRETSEQLAESLLQKIRNLSRSGSISSLRSVAILYRSDTGETGKVLKALREMTESRFRDIPLSFVSNAKMMKSEQIRAFLEALALISDTLSPPAKERKGGPKFIQESAKLLIKNNDCSDLFEWIKKQEIEKSQIFIHRIISHIAKWQPFVSAIPDGTDGVVPTSLTLYLGKLTEEAARFDRLSRRRHYSAAHTIRAFLRYLHEADHSIEQQDLPDAVNVLTMHKAKGLEWPVVFIITPEKQLFEPRTPDSPFDILRARLMFGSKWEQDLPRLEAGEGVRLLYVAQSRAQSILAYGMTEKSELPTFLENVLVPLDEWGAISEKLPIFQVATEKPVLSTSHSDLVSLSGCALRYSLEKHFGFEGKPLPQLYEGVSLHRCVQILHEQKMNGNTLTVEELDGIFEQSWIPYGQSGKRAEKRKLELKGYFMNYASCLDASLAGYRIIGVEKELRREVAVGEQIVLLQGKIDLLLESRTSRELTLVEIKLSPDSADLSDTDLQLSTYQYMLGLDGARRTIYCLKDGKEIPLDSISLNECRERIETLGERLLRFSNDEKFPPTDSKKTCSRCNLRDFCAAAQISETLQENPQNLRKIS